MILFSPPLHTPILSRELGVKIPEGDTQHEALLLMLQRKLEVLKHQLEEKEVEHSQKMTAGKLPLAVDISRHFAFAPTFK